MQPEQQQRIMGYFIEEAKDHLNTLEQGLLNLQSTIDDPEMVNEVFRAAHSVKGGAAMLGLSSIQKTAHRLEDYFKILKETPGIKPDQKLETLLLQVFDTLQALLEQLQTPTGLTDEAADVAMTQAQPVFEELNQYFTLLERQAATSEPSLPSADRGTIVQAETQLEDHALMLIFQNDVPTQLREMLQLFRQAEMLSDGRDRLQDFCQSLRDLGEAFGLAQWISLLEVTRLAIAHSENSYRTLAPIVLKDIKQAQDLVLMGRAEEIAPSSELQALVPAQTESSVDSDLANFFAIADGLDATNELDFSDFDLTEADSFALDLSEFDVAATTPADAEAESTDLSFDSLFDLSDFASVNADKASEPRRDSSEFGEANRNGPEMGMAELNSLADLFEGEVPDLGSTWQQEEVISTAPPDSQLDRSNGFDENKNDFSDLLSNPPVANEAIPSDSDDDLSSLFGDALLEAFDASNAASDSFELSVPTPEMLSTGQDLPIDISPLSDSISADLTAPDALELNTNSLNVEFAHNNLGELFAGLDESDLTFGSAVNDLLDDSLSDSLLNELDLSGLFEEASSVSAEASLDAFNSLEENLTPFENSDIDSVSEGSDSTQELMESAIADLTLEDSSIDLSNLSDPWNDTQLSSLSDLENLELNVPFENVDAQNANGLDELILDELNTDLEATYSVETETGQVDPLDLLNLDLENNALLSEFALTEEPVERGSDNLSEPSQSLSELSSDNLLSAESNLQLDELVELFNEQDLDESSDAETDLALDLEGLDHDFLDSETFNSNRIDELLDEASPEDSSLVELDLELEGLTDDFLETVSPNNSDDLLDETAALNSALEPDSLEVEFTSAELDGLSETGSPLSVGFGDASDLVEQLGELLDDGFEPDGFELEALEATNSHSLIAETVKGLEAPSDLFDALEIESLEIDIEEPSANSESLLSSASTEIDELFSLGKSLLSEQIAPSEETFSTELSLDDDFLSSLMAEVSESSEQIFADAPSLNLEDLDLPLSEISEEAAFPSNTQNELLHEFNLNSSDEMAYSTEDSSTNSEFESLDFEATSLDLASDDLDFNGLDLSTDLIIDDVDPESLDLSLDELELSPQIPDRLEDLESLLNDAPTDAAEQEFDSLLEAGIAEAAIPSLDAKILQQELSASVSDEMELGDPNNLLDEDLFENSGSSATGDLDNLDQLLEAADSFDNLDNLDAFLSDDPETANLAVEDDFADLESLLSDAPDALATPQTVFSASSEVDTEFDDLEKMLEDTNKTMGGSPAVKGRTVASSARRTPRPTKGLSEQTMRVPVKHLDNLSNLVGELVVNRNSLEQDQERLRQSLDNLLYQVQQLSDVGQRMQDLYERSLLESSLLASRQHHRAPFGSPERHSHDTSPTGVEYDPLEMDRFTGFHSLSQEMIELIVRVRESASDIEFIVDETDQVTRMFRQVTTQLQEGLTRSRMVPFAQAADRLPRAVRDIAMKCGRQAELVIDGRDTLIDKMILEHLYDPLTHLVNNAISHGIESPEVRQRAGKAPTGQITIRAFHQGNQTVLSVSDDGAGIDIERVKIKAIEKGLITSAEAQTLSRLDIYDLLFHPGFSTKDQADDFSGRGVGMDVVRTSLSEIRGAINTDSVQGKGTTFTIRLPLTLSISKALCCISDRARIAFPMDGVEDMLDVPKERLQTNAEGQPSISWRDVVLPVHPLSELLSYSRHLSRGTVYGGSQDDDMVSIVILRSAGNYLALQVDQVLGEQEIVIKQLEGPVPKPVGVAGATVLGDGRIMPIADVLELIDLSLGRIRRDVGSMWDQGAAQGVAETITTKTEPMVLIVDDSITVRELLSMTFNKVGYRVEQARDGQEAWEKLRSGLPCDIVFCDIEMPRMDGLEFLSRIQKDPNLSNLPIAMLTSRGADRHRQMAASLGASGYFTKPYLEEALLDAAQRMLKGEVLLANNG